MNLWYLKCLCVSTKGMQISFFCVPSFCCVWHFRRRLSSTLYQTTATFALGGQPLYVESLHRLPSDFRFVTLPAPVFHLLCSPAHAKRLHRSVCVDVCTSACILIWECYTCICVDVPWLCSMFIFDASLSMRVAGLKSLSVFWLLDNNRTCDYIIVVRRKPCISKMFQ